MSALQVVTGSSVTTPDTPGAQPLLSIVCPNLALSATDTSGTPVVQTISATYIYSPETAGAKYIEVLYTFELLAALLDSAPTNTTGGPTLFQMIMEIPGATSATLGSKYVVDAQIQTKGNSAMTPTYITKVTSLNGVGVIYFPVTNFFTVTAPGAPYTILVTLTQAV